MLQAYSTSRVSLVFAGLITVAIKGVGMYAIFALIEKRMTGWAFRGQS